MSNSTSSLPVSVTSGLSSSSLSESISSSLSSSTSTPVTSTSSLSTSTTSISSAVSVTFTQTQTITQTPSLSQPPVTVTRTTTSTSSSLLVVPSSTTSAPSTTTSASLQSNGSNGSGNGGGLSTAGKTAIAVVVPVAVVALLVLAGIFLYRRRKQKKDAEEARRKEIQDYGYNPNNDPTLPTVMQESNSEMAEDTSGYRGWGAAAAGSNRKTSTTLSGGLAQMSDAGSNVYGAGQHSPGVPTSDAHSGDGLMNRRETMGSDDLGALGVAPVTTNQPIRRGPSNASSAYSNGARSDNSDDQPPLPANGSYSYDYPPGQYGYTQHGPYGDGSYGGGQDNGMPIVRDVSARRNTRIQQGGTYQQGNSGIAQNF